jgi:Ca2+/H+ antiporter
MLKALLKSIGIGEAEAGAVMVAIAKSAEDTESIKLALQDLVDLGKKQVEELRELNSKIKQ